MKKLLFTLACLLTLVAFAQRFVQGVSNLSGLVALNPLNIHSNVFVAGGSAPGDGQGGVFIYDALSSAPTNADTILKPLSTTGRWLRVLPNISTITNGNGTTITYIQTFITTNVNEYITTNVITDVTQIYNTITNVTVQNIIANNFQQVSCVVTGTAPMLNWTNCFLDRLVLTGNTTPIMVGVPIDTNVPSHEVDIVQPVGAGYTVTFGDNIYWPYGTNVFTFEQDTTNKLHFQWNGEALRGWLVDGSSGGSGISGLTANYLPVATSGTTLGDSIVSQGGVTNLSIGGTLSIGSSSNVFTKVLDQLQYSSGNFLTSIAVVDTVGGATSIGTTSGTSYIGGSTNLQLSGDLASIYIDLSGFYYTTNVTPMFRVLSGSGYSGAGTNYLSDDGTYKAGTGLGTTINPTDKFLPVRTSANTFGDSVVRQNDSASAGTNILINISSSNVLTNGDKLLSVGNATVEKAALTYSGALYLGANAVANYGGMSESDGVIQVFDSAAGDSATVLNDAFAVVDASVFTVYGNARVSIYTNGANALWQYYTNGFSTAINVAATDAGAQLTITEAGNTKVNIQPSIADGSAPFVFGSGNTHTSGNLLEVANNGTNVSKITFTGEHLIGSSATTSGAGSILTGVKDVTGGDPNDIQFLLDLKESAISNRRGLFGWGGQLDGGMGSTWLYGDGTNGNKMTLTQIATDITLGLYSYSGATNYVLLRPTSVATDISYYMGTDKTHTSGNLLEVANNGTNKVSIGHMGNTTIGSVTKAQKTALTPADGMMVYQTDNTPGFRLYVNGAWVIVSTAADP